MTLRGFVKAAAGRDFAWGQNDCLLFLADWVLARHGRDPAEGLRGTYRTALGATRIVLRAGGLAALIDARLAPLGLARASLPGAGDIAVTLGPEGESGAIVLGASVLQLCERGVMVRRLPILAAWRV